VRAKDGNQGLKGPGVQGRDSGDVRSEAKHRVDLAQGVDCLVAVPGGHRSYLRTTKTRLRNRQAVGDIIELDVPARRWSSASTRRSSSVRKPKIEPACSWHLGLAGQVCGPVTDSHENLLVLGPCFDVGTRNFWQLTTSDVVEVPKRGTLGGNAGYANARVPPT
jgi:hypothetical protein